MTSSFSYWIEDVSIETLEAYALNLVGKFTVYNTVKLGSGEGPMFSNVCKKR
jgi:hypothetical protein